MSAQTVTFEAPTEAIAAVDEIASTREVDRAEILRDALAMYLAEHESLKSDLEEADRQIEAGETIPHEEVVAWFNAQHDKKSEAA